MCFWNPAQWPFVEVPALTTFAVKEKISVDHAVTSFCVGNPLQDQEG